MPRFGRSKNPINSSKHVVDVEGGLTNTRSITPIVTAVGAPSTPMVPTEVMVGATINAFFISFFIIGGTGAPVNGSQNWYIIKTHQAQAQSNFPDPGETGTSLIRNQIIHEEKGLVGSGDGTAMAFKGVIVVPRGMRRVREGDTWFIVAKNNGTDDAQFCLKTIYKSFR